MIKHKLEELKYIAQGYINYIDGKISKGDDLIKKYKSDLKLEKCLKCSLYLNDVCDSNKEDVVVCDFEYKGEMIKKGEVKKGCGCFIPAKILSDSKCPLGKFEDL